ncbi:HAMP domain-containing histidine kinase [Aliifodinibius salicampi]|uniref:histidine kinase n=1 Tax=Fodinibius salicampi TaxID=1920655 RepID=A0ABT3PU54_9BACT|nr:HAMP domain-containing sensor histidine kinase [Fodinibius salicampi]MCW9711379.1 HAMP domain-containing histidine kinase [Fodinibius salicampi]
MKHIAKGIALLLDETGLITEVIQDNMAFFEDKNPCGAPLTAYLYDDSVQKSFELIYRIKKEGAAFDWEMHARVGGGNHFLTFSGIKIENGIIMVGTTSSEDTETFLNGLMEINNEQLNKLRYFIKKKGGQEAKIGNDFSMYNNMSSLNNELANTKRKLIKKTTELERINKLKDQMLGMAAHDLRNPLSVIQNYADFLMEDIRKGSVGKEQYELAKEIKESSEYMVQIVEGMLDISAIESGSISLDREDVDLHRLIQRAVSLNRPSAEKKNIRLDISLCDESCDKLIDYHKFQQVLNNLISNAIKYSEANTTTTVGIEKDEEEIIIYVADEGQGIPEEDRHKLFQPFAKIDVEATAGEKSTGLGLAITKKIVEAHGGTIDVKTKVGEGTTFYVRLPG